jgi:hypothetical protein
MQVHVLANNVFYGVLVALIGGLRKGATGSMKHEAAAHLHVGGPSLRTSYPALTPAYLPWLLLRQLGVLEGLDAVM